MGCTSNVGADLGHHSASPESELSRATTYHEKADAMSHKGVDEKRVAAECGQFFHNSQWIFARVHRRLEAVAELPAPGFRVVHHALGYLEVALEGEVEAREPARSDVYLGQGIGAHRGVAVKQ